MRTIPVSCGIVLAISAAVSGCVRPSHLDDSQVPLVHGKAPSGRNVLFTWEELSNLLRNADCDVSSSESVEGCQAFARILSLDSADVFWEMTLQTDRPVVALYGYFAIKKQFPMDAVSAALGILLRSSSPASPLHAALYSDLMGQENHDTVMEILEDLARMPSVSRNSLSIIMGTLSCRGCYKWYHNSNRATCSTSFEAAVFDRVNSGECSSKGQTPSKLMQDRLSHYARIPGFPQLVYVIHAPTSEEGFTSVLASVLEDRGLDDMPDIALLCHRHRDYIKKNIDISSLEITPERKKMIEESLSYERQP